ncbi:solute carrier family 49 member A3-like [Lineus longissimus]|uniref:solute carrier family 49 member A3-like n=1 Tax=Lineus longissimus TaxID=88925 RepID=UPI00315DA5AE
MLLTLCLLNASNAMLWISFSPIANITAEFYGVDTMAVNWLSLVFLVASIPCGFFATWLLDSLGLRTGLITGAWINLIGSVLRLVSGLNVPEAAAYPLVIIGQTIAACAQPFLLFAPTKLAALWFEENHRATANMIASMSNPLGILLANILSPVIVNSKADFPLMLEIYTAPAILTTLMATFGIWSALPPTPPTASAAEQHESFFEGLRDILRNKAYWVLFFAFGTGVALFNTLSSLLEQVFCARGYSDDFAGICGALLIGCGVIGAGVAGVIVDKTKKFEEVAKLCYVMAALSLIFFTLISMHRDQPALVALSLALFGFFGFALYPVCLELGVECTFPVAEGTSAGFLMISGQIIGVVFIMIMQVIAQPLSAENMPYQVCTGNQTLGDTNITPLDYTIPDLVLSGAASLAACVLLLAFWCPYKRLRRETQSVANPILNFSGSAAGGSSNSQVNTQLQ